MKQLDNFFLVVFLLVCTSAYCQEIKKDAEVPAKQVNNMQFRYYYYPNLQLYYDTLDAVYLCKENNKWIKKTELLSNSRGYSMANGVYVPIKDYLGDEPYQFIEQHKKDFPKNFNSRKQTKVIVKQKSH